MKKLAPKPNKRQCKTSKVYYCSTIITFRMLLFKTTFLLLFFFHFFRTKYFQSTVQ